MAKNKKGGKPQWFHCPNCGEEVRTDWKACPACGSDEETGWKQDYAGEGDASTEGLANDSDDDFDYDEYVAREFPDTFQPKPNPRQFWGWLFLVLALIGLLAATLLGR